MDKPIGEILVDMGAIDRIGLDRALLVQREHGGRLGGILRSLGLVSDLDWARALSLKADVPMAEPGDYPAAPLFAGQVSEKFLKEMKILPLAETEEGIVLAMADPLDRYAAEAMALVADTPVLPRVGTERDIEAALARLYQSGRSSLNDIVDEPGVETSDRPAPTEPVRAASVGTGAQPGVPRAAPVEPVEQQVPGLTGPLTYPGSDRYLSERSTGRAVVDVRDGELVLNFENAELREVVRVILGETLKANYIYDPRVQGVVSLQTVGALKTDAVLSALETLLRMNGAALVAVDDLFKIVPADEAIRGNLVPEIGEGGPIPPGYAVRIIPLRFISAIQMQQLLEPFVPPGGIVRVDIDRNLILLAGTGAEVTRMIDTVGIFDVDWLSGMSVGIFPLDHVAADAVAQELDAIFGDLSAGPAAGLLRFMPIERLNALLVVTQNSRYLEEAEVWINRLDRGTTTGQNLYVYYLENGKAADLAKILSDIFAERDGRDDEISGRVGPGRTPVEVQSQQPAQPPGGAQAQQQAQQQPQGQGQQSQPVPATAVAPPRSVGGRTSGRIAFNEGGDIRIIADEVNNALLILASVQDYEMVEAAIRKLDIVPLQVLVEATIAEVQLTDDLRYGVQWFFKNAGPEGSNNRFSLATAAGATIAAPQIGFSYILQSAGGRTNFQLDVLEALTKVDVISSPHLLIQDNQSAELQVGDEVPIITQQQQSTSGEANVINNVEFRDTGVILNVTPRVSATGSINLEIEQELSQVVPTAVATLTPTISQRRIKSSAVVQSGDTILIGGLISEQDSRTKSGIPFLSQLPLIGWLFGQDTDDLTRTELIVLITPRVVRDAGEARRVTEEMRSRLRELHRSQRFQQFEKRHRDAWDIP